jgi:uncharacterized protein YmfQ (DUF2313 family)
MGLGSGDYQNQLTSLLPKGPAWHADTGSVLAQLLAAWSTELARIDNRLNDLINEADPRSTYELLLDYERIFGLPADCMAGIEQTIQQRYAALLTQMTTIGGQSRAYFIALALAAGYVITITEFTPFTVGSTVADILYGSDWQFAWQINAALTGAVTYFLTTSSVNDALSTFGNTQLECLISRFKPAHTIPIFSYT